MGWKLICLDFKDKPFEAFSPVLTGQRSFTKVDTLKCSRSKRAKRRLTLLKGRTRTATLTESFPGISGADRREVGGGREASGAGASGEREGGEDYAGDQQVTGEVLTFTLYLLHINNEEQAQSLSSSSAPVSRCQTAFHGQGLLTWGPETPRGLQSRTKRSSAKFDVRCSIQINLGLIQMKAWFTRTWWFCKLYNLS